MKIDLTPVKDSSQIAAIGYDIPSKTLAVQFWSRKKGQEPAPGAVYHYKDFPLEKFTAFQNAESKGTFFGERVRNQFPTTKQPE